MSVPLLSLVARRFLQETTLSFLEEVCIRVEVKRVKRCPGMCRVTVVTQMRAAVRIQSLFRGHRARVFVTEQRAAIFIQSRIRGYIAGYL